MSRRRKARPEGTPPIRYRQNPQSLTAGCGGPDTLSAHAAHAESLTPGTQASPAPAGDVNRLRPSVARGFDRVLGAIKWGLIPLRPKRSRLRISDTNFWRHRRLQRQRDLCSRHYRRRRAPGIALKIGASTSNCEGELGRIHALRWVCRVERGQLAHRRGWRDVPATAWRALGGPRASPGYGRPQPPPSGAPLFKEALTADGV